MDEPSDPFGTVPAPAPTEGDAPAPPRVHAEGCLDVRLADRRWRAALESYRYLPGPDRDGPGWTSRREGVPAGAARAAARARSKPGTDP